MMIHNAVFVVSIRENAGGAWRRTG